MCVCRFMCMCVHVYVCVPVCVYVHVYVCVCNRLIRIFDQPLTNLSSWLLQCERPKEIKVVGSTAVDVQVREVRHAEGHNIKYRSISAPMPL